jgi:MFS family permease
MPRPRDFIIGPWRAVAVLGVTQILAWGALFYPPVLTIPLIAADRGWSQAFAMAGFSVGLFCGGLVSRNVGALIDRFGGHVVMPFGSLIGALGLVGLVAAQKPWLYFGVWVVLGVAMAASLYDPAFASIARIFGAAARTPITALTLVAGFASTVSWPATQFLIGSVGWRGTYLVYAALLAFLAAPLHAFALPRRRAERVAPARAVDSRRAVVLPPRGLAFVLVATAFASYAFVPSALSAQLLAIFERFGLSPTVVVAIGMLFGPAQVLARLCEFSFGRHLHPLWSARFAAGSGGPSLLDAGCRNLRRDVRLGQRPHDHRARHGAAGAVRGERLWPAGRTDRRFVSGRAIAGPGTGGLDRRTHIRRARIDGRRRVRGRVAVLFCGHALAGLMNLKTPQCHRLSRRRLPLGVVVRYQAAIL